MPVVYVLNSQKTGGHYVGSSREATASVRLASHNAGKVRSTKFGRPWVVVYQEECVDYTQARKRENFFKTGCGRRWLADKLA